MQFRKRSRQTLFSGVGLFLFSSMGNSFAANYQFYGALQVQAETVSPDKNNSVIDDYNGLRDAYSRMGLKVTHKLTNDYSLLFQLEVPFDSANLKVQDPWNQEVHERILKLEIDSPLGRVWIGRDWMPYYNAIAYPVDQFSSYYSGFATYTTYRLDETVAYISPNLKGLQITGAYSQENGLDNDDRFQVALSYSLGATAIAIGMDELDGPDNVRIYGVSISTHLTDSVYLGAKYERFESDINSGYSSDDSMAANLFVSYQLEKNTWKLMLAKIDNYGESVFHFGWDYQQHTNLKIFAEVYNEEETAAITDLRSGREVFDAGASGGSALVFGLHLKFETPRNAFTLSAP